MHIFKLEQKGFTLIELLVVIAIVGLLSSIVLTSLENAKMRSRDGERLSGMRQLQYALELYYDSFGWYPTSDNAGAGGWDTTGNGTFLTPLVPSFLSRHLSDPTTNDLNGNYAYYRYPAGSNGCDASRGAFYILGIRNMETSGNPYPLSEGFRCTGRNWQLEFDWVLGRYEH